MSNPKPDLHNINAYIKFDENTLRFTPVIVLKLEYGCVAVKKHLQNWRNLSISNPKADHHKINARFGENTLVFTKVIVRKWKYSMLRADIFVRNWQNLPISNPKTDLHNIIAQTKFGDNLLIFISHHPEMKIWMCHGQKLTKCAHLQSQTKFCENPLIFTQVTVWKQKIRMDIQTTNLIP